MEEKINIAEILKDKKDGIRLYSPIFGECTFCCLREDTNDICVKKHHGVKEFFDSKGLYYNTGEIMLFPSKSMRNWRKFAWKKGDVLIRINSEYCIGIFDEWTSDDYSTFSAKYINLGLSDNFSCSYKCKTEEWEKTENSKNYISEIERVMNGKLNLQTLEIQIQPEFKDGDIVVYGKSVAICRKICKHTLFPYVSIDEASRLLFNDNPNVSPDECRFATEAERQQLFSALEKEGKAWDAENKMIVNLKPKCEFKPFDRCIWKIRNCEGSIWQASFVSYVDEYGASPMGMSIDEDLVNLIILPYNDKTKLLVGTTDDWKGCEQ